MSDRPIRDVEGARKALSFFRVMAFAAGVALFILVVIIILNGGFGRGGLSAAWSPIHGVIYFVYVISIANLGFKVGWSLPRDGADDAERLRAGAAVRGRAPGAP